VHSSKDMTLGNWNVGESSKVTEISSKRSNKVKVQFSGSTRVLMG